MNVSRLPKPVRGKIAKVLDSTGVAINKGSNDGVELGMYFAVLDSEPDIVKDPDTNEVLGELFRPKVRLQIVSVEDNFSVARTYETRRVNVGGTGSGASLGAISKMFEPPKYVTKRTTLRTDESTWDDFSESESLVKTGDAVEQISVTVSPNDGDSEGH